MGVKKMWFKVLSKDKEGCLVKLPKVGVQKLLWKEVNENFDFDPSNPYKVYMKEEVAKKQEEGFEHLRKAQLFFFLGNGPTSDKTLAYSLAFLEEIQTASSILQITEHEAMVLVKQMVDKSTTGLLKQGVGIGGRLEECLSPKQYQQNERNKEKLKKEEKKREKKEEGKEESTGDGTTYFPFAGIKNLFKTKEKEKNG